MVLGSIVSSDCCIPGTWYLQHKPPRNVAPNITHFEKTSQGKPPSRYTMSRAKGCMVGEARCLERRVMSNAQLIQNILGSSSAQEPVRQKSVIIVLPYFFPSHLLSAPFYSLSLLVVTQIRGHIAGSLSPPLPHYGLSLTLFSREYFSCFCPRRLASNCACPR